MDNMESLLDELTGEKRFCFARQFSVAFSRVCARGVALVRQRRFTNQDTLNPPPSETAIHPANIFTC